MNVFDYIVVGSGCTGAMAAQTLVENGARVTMLDGGVTDTKYGGKVPNDDYLSIRKRDPCQYEYFIGKDFEGIPFGDIKTGEHLTPPRKFMLDNVSEWMPLLSNNFFPLESLALGGLGNAWGLGCTVFSRSELLSAGLEPGLMNAAYEVISKRIGISGSRDDAAPYTAASLSGLMPAIEMDSTGKNLFENYQKKKNMLNKKGFFMGRPTLALITGDMNGRKAYRYKDLDFYCDQEKSAYRPWLTINELRKQANFNYAGGVVVLRFEENEDAITVEGRSINNNEPVSFQCKKLILCSGCLSTARIVLRSYSAHDVRLPVISNPYTYLPAIQPYLLGKDTDKWKIGFGQLNMFYDPQFNNMDVGMAALFSYRSLMTFHILKETPLGVKAGYDFLRYMIPAFTIAGIFHPERGSSTKFLSLKKDTSQLSGDSLHVNYQLNDDEKNRVAHTERKFTRTLRQLNCFVMKKIDPGHGSGIHYAGTLPFSATNEKFKLLPNGKLGQTRNVFVADGSGFNYLPAKGLTFSLMANAHNVAMNALKE